MGQAVGDPDELERFAHAIQSFVDELKEEVSKLNGQFTALGDSWKDVKRSQFEEAYGILLQQIAAFELNASEQVPYLLALAARLREYLQS